MFEIHLKMSHLVKISKYLLKEIGNSKHLIEKIGKHNKRHLTSFKKMVRWRLCYIFTILTLISDFSTIKMLGISDFFEKIITDFD